jgi:hypothetical protein
MVRKIIKPQSEEYLLHIPKEYIDREVEILVLPIREENTSFFDEEELLLRVENIHNKTSKSLSRDEVFDGL